MSALVTGLLCFFFAEDPTHGPRPTDRALFLAACEPLALAVVTDVRLRLGAKRMTAPPASR